MWAIRGPFSMSGALHSRLEYAALLEAHLVVLGASELR